MSRFIGMVVVAIVVAIVVAGVFAYRGGAQENATLEARVAELEDRVAVVEGETVPVSRQLGPEGFLGRDGLPMTAEAALADAAWLADPALVAGPGEELHLICQEYDPLSGLRQGFDPLTSQAIAPGLVGLACGRVPVPSAGG